MIAALAVSGVIIVLVLAIHMVGLGALLVMIRWRGSDTREPGRQLVQATLILAVVIGVLGLHGIEIWLFAGLYLLLGEIRTLEEALYFSASTFSTLGYGDVVLSASWRLVAAMEGITGFLLIGWSTAFLVSVVGRLRALEADWFSGPDHERID
jgi:hypothetical protein